jgi:hypothetical protein
MTPHGEIENGSNEGVFLEFSIAVRAFRETLGTHRTDRTKRLWFNDLRHSLPHSLDFEPHECGPFHESPKSRNTAAERSGRWARSGDRSDERNTPAGARAWVIRLFSEKL